MRKKEEQKGVGGGGGEWRKEEGEKMGKNMEKNWMLGYSNLGLSAWKSGFDNVFFYHWPIWSQVYPLICIYH